MKIFKTETTFKKVFKVLQIVLHVRRYVSNIP
jgi:hypothetical protein